MSTSAVITIVVVVIAAIAIALLVVNQRSKDFESDSVPSTAGRSKKPAAEYARKQNCKSYKRESSSSRSLRCHRRLERGLSQAGTRSSRGLLMIRAAR